MTRLLLGAGVVIALALSACKQESSTSHAATPAPAPVAQQPLQMAQPAPQRVPVPFIRPRAGTKLQPAPIQATSGQPR